MPIPERPLSPFTTIYRWQITMTLSILHRITGVILAFGAFGIAWWLLAVSASTAPHYDQFIAVATSIPGKILLAGFSWCLLYHLLNGIRHLAWDAGKGFEIRQFTLSGWVVVVLSFALTAVLWIVAMNVAGAAA